MGNMETPKNKKGTKVRADFSPYEDRLKNTTITNKDYASLIQRYDSPDTLFYLDPPYEGSVDRDDYTHSHFDLEELEDRLSNIEGKFILSMNDSPNVRKIFKKYPIKVVETVYQRPEPHKVKELIIKNY